jgi:hypothetical protein
MPLPFMRPAEASVLKIGAGIDRLSSASKRAAKAAAINFMFLSQNEFGQNTPKPANANREAVLLRCFQNSSARLVSRFREHRHPAPVFVLRQ